MKEEVNILAHASLIQQCILPENWPCFRSGADNYTGRQCLTMLMVIIVTYLAWELVSLRLVPLIAQQQYIQPRVIAQNLCSLAHLVLKLSWDLCLGKESGGALPTLMYFFLGSDKIGRLQADMGGDLRYSFRLFSAAS